jgi:hypothetical protein
VQTGQYHDGEDGSCSVAARWASGGYEEVRADRPPIRSDPFLSHIWAGNGSAGPHLSVWVGPLGCVIPYYSVRVDTFGREVVVWIVPLEMSLSLSVSFFSLDLSSLSIMSLKLPTTDA